MLIAAPLAAYIPLAALAAVLVVVAFNMSDHHEFRALLKRSWPDALVLLATFLITAFFDLVVAIGVGVALSFLLRAAKVAKPE
jgi:SulP family sulfate permease